MTLFHLLGLIGAVVVAAIGWKVGGLLGVVLGVPTGFLVGVFGLVGLGLTVGWLETRRDQLALAAHSARIGGPNTAQIGRSSRRRFALAPL